MQFNLFVVLNVCFVSGVLLLMRLAAFSSLVVLFLLYIVTLAEAAVQFYRALLKLSVLISVVLYCSWYYVVLLGVMELFMKCFSHKL